MTTKRLTQRRTRLEKHFPEVFSDLVSGVTQPEIARKYGVDPSAVAYFKRRNAEALEKAMSEVVDYTRDVSIANKEWRIREAQGDYDKVIDWLTEHSMTERTVRWDKDGNEVGETIRIRKDALDLLKGYRREVAEELGQLPKADLNINLKAAVLVRQIEGNALEELG